MKRCFFLSNPVFNLHQNQLSLVFSLFIKKCWKNELNLAGRTHISLRSCILIPSMLRSDHSNLNIFVFTYFNISTFPLLQGKQPYDYSLIALLILKKGLSSSPEGSSIHNCISYIQCLEVSYKGHQTENCNLSLLLSVCVC